jgi:hypothetical protein
MHLSDCCHEHNLGAQLGGTRAQLRAALEVVDEVFSHTHERIRAAKEMATAYRDAAATVRELLAHVGRCANFPKCFALEDLAQFRRIAFNILEFLPTFMDGFRAFYAEHGIHVEPDVSATFEAYNDWVQALPDQIDPVWRAALKQLDDDIAEQADEVKQTAREWSVCDGDGLDSADL